MYGKRLNRAWLLIFSIMLVASQWAAAQAGHLDPTFGNGGVVTTDFGDQNYTNNMATANAVIIQPNGQIVVGGGIPGNNDFPIPAVARYNTNGSLDTTFGTNGITSIASIEGVPIMAIALQSDGKIVAVGENFVARYLSTGVLDSAFGTGGIASLGTDFIGTSPQGVVIQPDGSILVADRYLLRLLSNGQFDTSFGTGARRGPLVIRPLGWRFFRVERSWLRLPFRDQAASSLNMTQMALSTPPSELAASWPVPERRPVWRFWQPGNFWQAGP
jgi:uncharacterized delta-60 repeat protein